MGRANISDSTGPSSTSRGDRWLTLPNVITILRMIGSPGLILLALAGAPWWLALLVIALVVTEWLDGFLARSWNSASATGARLDTVADAIFCMSLLAAIVLLNPTLIRNEVAWICAATASYLLSWLTSWFKFHQLPSYHTWAAKGAWLIVGPSILLLLAGWYTWPFRIAMLCVVFANLEAVAITLLLPKCHVNIPSVWHVLRRP